MRTCVLAFFLFVLADGAYAQGNVGQLDIHILEQLAKKRTPAKTKLWRTVSDTHQYVHLGIPVGLFAAGVIGEDKAMRQNAAYIATTTVSTTVVNILLKKLFKRPRPFVAHVSFVPVYEASGYSFPSGHTQAAFGTATALSRAYPKWYVIAPSMIWAGAVGYSRMYLGVHYPSDVLVGAGLGTATAFGLGFMRY